MIEDGRADRVARRGPEHALRCGARIAQRAIGIDHRDHVGCVLDQRPQPLLAGADGGFGFVALGDIARVGDNPSNGPFCEEVGGRHLDAPELAVGASEPVRDRVRGARTRVQLGEERSDALLVLGRGGVGRLVAEELLSLLIEETTRARAGVCDHARLVDDGHEIARVLHQGPESHFALAKFALGALLFGHVRDDRHRGDNPSGSVAERRQRDVDVDRAPVAADVTGLVPASGRTVEHVREGSRELRLGLGVEDGRRRSDHFLRPPAEHLLARAVPEVDCAAPIEGEDRQRRRLHDGARARPRSGAAPPPPRAGA